MRSLNFSIDRHKEMVAGLELLRMDNYMAIRPACAPSRLSRALMHFVLDETLKRCGTKRQKKKCYHSL
jgi:hypothetical protein